jgi:hypothetical protein
MKNLLRYLAFTLMIGGAFAQSNLPACQGADASRWSNCFGTFIFASGNKYSGQWKDSRRSGHGTEIFANGNKYVGEFKNDKPNGLGTLYSTNGSVINQGMWADGNFVGSAPAQQATAPNTEIEKQSNLPACQGSVSSWSNCFGDSTYTNGVKFVGEWKQGKPNGQGSFIFPDGSKFVGESKDGKFNGTVTFTNADGMKFVGEVKDNKKHGQGTQFDIDGSVLRKGTWVDDKFIGSAPAQQATAPNTEIEKLRTEAELERKRRQELEEQLRLVQQQPQTTTPNVSAPSTGKRLALVVGNANYKVRPLKNPRNDADDISRSLRSSGFEVIDLRDASLQQMRNGVRQFGDRLINNDVGLVYYSGHGVEVKGRNYFIPVNADIMREDEIADQGLDVSLILEKMNTAGKGVNILIVDACRDDPFGRSFRSSSRGLAQMDAPRGTIIAYATSPGKVASDGDPRERNSPYTKNLVKAMQQPNKPIEQVFKEVRRAVQEETKNQQTPWENTSLSGDFYFKVQR